jgi:uncharacterized protein (TIGR02284 family)
MDRKKIIKELRDLAELLADSRKGYDLAAQKVEDGRLKDLLKRFGSGRVPMTIDIDHAIETLGSRDKVPDEGTVKGQLHRTWMEIRDALSTTENANVLDECRRGERYILGRYETVAEQMDLSDDLRGMLSRHRGTIEGNLLEVSELEKIHAAQGS